MRVGWLFLAWMMIEIGLFASVGAWIGVLATWGLVLGSGVAGIMLIRWQKRSLMTQAFSDLRSLGDAVTPAAHSALIMLAAVLLILPGFLTDLLGLALLIPWVRNRVIDYVRRNTRITTSTFAAGNPARQTGFDVIEATAQEVPPSAPALHKPSGWTKP